MSFDCAICAGPIENPAVAENCTHHFCAGCYEEWIDRVPNCPTCRAPAKIVRLDREFAAAVGAPITKHEDNMKRTKISRDGWEIVRVESPVGLTMRDANEEEAYLGCRFTKVWEQMGGWRKQLMAGDALFEVNGEAVRNHAHAVTLIDRACERAGACELTIRREGRLAGGAVQPTQAGLERHERAPRWCIGLRRVMVGTVRGLEEGLERHGRARRLRSHERHLQEADAHVRREGTHEIERWREHENYYRRQQRGAAAGQRVLYASIVAFSRDHPNVHPLNLRR